MAIFKCMNCGIFIKKKIMSSNEAHEKIKCPKCGSTWVEYHCPDADLGIRSLSIGEEMIYSDE